MASGQEFQQFIITQFGNEDRWRLEYRHFGGVLPTHDYESGRKLLARLAQLLQTGPIAPQTWPEMVEIQTVTTE